MSNRLKFDLVCPNGHNVAVEFSHEEFEAALQSETLQFHCNTCDTDWTPTAEEMATFRKELPE
jgi:hypothetical protein